MLKKRDRRRPRGNASWKPTDAVLELVGQAIDVIEEYRVYGAMTLRQILYRLAATIPGFVKDDNAADRLSNHLTRARRAGLIAWTDMRDDRGVLKHAPGWSSAEELLGLVARWVKNFTLRGDIDQPFRIIIWCEAAGIVPMVAGMVAPYGAEVRSKSGFDGAGAKEALAREILEHYRQTGRATVLLHLGDYDPSGEHVYSALVEDLRAFLEDVADDALIARRVALTEAQIISRSIPTEPRKTRTLKDGRIVWADDRAYPGIAGDVSVTCQLEALAPPDLESILELEILRWWDEDAHEALLERQIADKERLQAWLDSADEAADD